MTPPVYIDGKFAQTVTSLEATIGIQTPYIQAGPGSAVLKVPEPTNADELAILSQAQTFSSKTLLQPIITSAQMTSPIINTPTLTAPVLDTPVMSGGNWTSGAMTQPVITTGVLSSPTVYIPVMTGGSWLSGTLTSPAINSPVITSGGASTSTVKAAVATDALVTPFNMQAHHGIAKCWLRFNTTTGTLSILGQYNVSALVYVSTGVYDVSFSTPFATTGYVIMGVGRDAAANVPIGQYSNVGTATCQLVVVQPAGGVFNPINLSVVFYGDQ